MALENAGYFGKKLYLREGGSLRNASQGKASAVDQDIILWGVALIQATDLLPSSAEYARNSRQQSLVPVSWLFLALLLLWAILIGRMSERVRAEANTTQQHPRMDTAPNDIGILLDI